MPWGRMDDKFHRNAKVRALRRAKGGREALGVWTFWWSWCLDDPELTGFVPTDELPPADARAAALLVEVGLWEPTEGGYRFHDFGDYNPRREQVDAKREADRARLAAKRAASRDGVARDISATSRATNLDVESTRVPSHPIPSRPDPVPIEREGAREDELPDQSPDGWLVVAKGYQARWESATGTAWMAFAPHRGDLELLWRWAAKQADLDASTPEAVTSRLLDRYFADPWASSKRWPVTHLARCAAKYFAPDPESVERARERIRAEIDLKHEAQQEAYARRDYDAANQLAETITNLAARLDAGRVLGPLKRAGENAG